jgi:serine-type D-Ala-D-Ala endopeptidase (penicillin-binding protein 7)
MSGTVGLLTITIGLKVLDKCVPEQKEIVEWLMSLEEEQHSVQHQLSAIGSIGAKIQQPPQVAPETEMKEDVYTDLEWLPPMWFDSSASETLWILENLNDRAVYEQGPKIYSRSAFVVDIDSGEVLWEKNADARRAVASLSKLVSSLTLPSLDVDLDTQVCLDRTMEPNFSGANTKFVVGGCTTGWDMLGAALVSSDNGAAYGYAQLAGLNHGQFQTSMNDVAEALRMTESSFVDPAGIHDENISTARDITRAAIAASVHPEISIASSAKGWQTQVTEDRIINYTSTNKLLWREVDWIVAKTGYTHTARAGFSGVYEQNGRRIAITTLGAWYSSRRWKDVNTIINWVAKH